jgi:endonuclease/exonuclease/phosphatase (EEP) superfamily protein YafD
MTIKTVQWNIGGGKIRKPDSSVEGPYNEEGLEHVIGILAPQNADIITLQETHAKDDKVQAEYIAKALGLSHVVNDIYNDSHLEAGQGLGQAILSRFPLDHHTFKFLQNPNYTAVRPNGEKWVSHNKGVTRCEVKLSENNFLEVVTTHFIPFGKFFIDPLGNDQAALRKHLQESITPKNSTYLLQGDINLNNRSAREFLPLLFTLGVEEVELQTPTTPDDKWYDHVLYRGLEHVKSLVLTSALTDHLPVVSEFTIAD